MKTMKEKIIILDSLISTMNGGDARFARNLVDYYSRKGGLTPKQAPYVDKLIERATKEEEKEESFTEQSTEPQVMHNEAPVIEGVEPLIALFDRAKENKIAYPRISFNSEDESKVSLVMTGPASKNPGAVNVRINGDWYGVILRDGTIREAFGRTIPDDIIKTVQEFAENPSKAGKAYGQKMSSCCFCSRPLTTTDSVYYGYGPICAEKWGLEWGLAREHLKEEKLEELTEEIKNFESS